MPRCNKVKTFLGIPNEAFALGYVEFHDPDIRVLMPPTVHVLVKLYRVISILCDRTMPRARAIELRHSFEKTITCPIMAQNDKNGPGIAFTFFDNGCKATF